MLEGANQKVELGNKARFRSEAEFNTFVRVLVDNRELTREDYIVSKGSIIVELTAKFINTLIPGSHTITIQSTDGKSVSKFEVVEKPVQMDANKPAKPMIKENKPMVDNKEEKPMVKENNKSNKQLVKPEAQKEKAPKTGDEITSLTIIGLMVMGLASLVVLKKKFN